MEYFIYNIGKIRIYLCQELLKWMNLKKNYIDP